MKLTLALLALLAASAGAAPVNKCVWSAGTCNASPGFVLSSVPAPIKPAGPLAESMLRAFALDAACTVHRDAASCEAASASGCAWNTENVGRSPGWAAGRRLAWLGLQQLDHSHPI
jgi:hypothetical protein